MTWNLVVGWGSGAEELWLAARVERICTQDFVERAYFARDWMAVAIEFATLAAPIADGDLQFL
jgi:hypothetical protein